MKRYYVTWTDINEEKFASSRAVKANDAVSALVQVVGNIKQNQIRREAGDSNSETIYYCDATHSFVVNPATHRKGDE